MRMRSLVSPLLFALAMALELNINIFWPENANQSFDSLAAGFFTATHQRGGEWPFVATR